MRSAVRGGGGGAAVVGGEGGGARRGGQRGHAAGEREARGQLGRERTRRVDPGQHVEHGPARVEHEVRAVAGGGGRDRAPVAVVDRHARHRALARPVQDHLLAQQVGDPLVRVQRGAEQAAVRARQLLVEPPEQPQRHDRLATGGGRALRGLEVRVPVQARHRGVPLRGHRIDPRPGALERGGGDVPAAHRERGVRGDRLLEPDGAERAEPGDLLRFGERRCRDVAERAEPGDLLRFGERCLDVDERIEARGDGACGRDGRGGLGPGGICAVGVRRGSGRGDRRGAPEREHAQRRADRGEEDGGPAGDIVGRRAVGGAKVGGAKVGGAKVGGAKVGGAKVGGAKVGGAKVGGAKVGGAKVGGAKVEAHGVTVRAHRAAQGPGCVRAALTHA